MKTITRMLLFAAPLMLALGFAAPAVAEDAAGEKTVSGFPAVLQRPVTLWSDGTRLAGDLFYPKGLQEGAELPAIVMCHGWGGVKAHLNRMCAPQFAAEGYVVLTFDYRGWGESDCRLVVTGQMPEPDDRGMVTVKARAVRELVDPFDQQEDIDAAISYLLGEAMVDGDRIGLWGSSFGGGHVVWRAAHDKRVKCIVSQVGAMDQRSGLEMYLAGMGLGLDVVERDRIQRARGELAPVPTTKDTPVVEGLIGIPYNARFVRFVPADHVDKINIPVLLIDAEREHYFDIAENSGRVYRNLKGRVPVSYHVLKDIEHYDVYRGETMQKVMALEIDWFNSHLRGLTK